MNMKKWVAEAINQAEIIDAVAEKLAEKFESEEHKEHPPYGVPVEVWHHHYRCWMPRISAGDGKYYDHLRYISDLPESGEWRYKPVDWGRYASGIKIRMIGKHGSIFCLDTETGIEVSGYYNGERILHIDRRPE